jgi:hypothetical protein
MMDITTTSSLMFIRRLPQAEVDDELVVMMDMTTTSSPMFIGRLPRADVDGRVVTEVGAPQC